MAAVLGPIGDLGAHALSYATAGFEVFPADPRSKAPLTDKGFYDATTNPDQIQGWWARWPGALIANRIPAQLLLTDIDPRHGGEKTWLALKAEIDGLPVTRVHRSGRGDLGMHFWWLRPGAKLSTRKLDDWAKERGLAQQVGPNRWTAGIDLLHHDLRYTILPPSPHPDTGKPYRWHDGRGLEVDPAPLPALLADLLTAEELPPAPPPGPVDPDSIADWFSASTPFSSILGPQGWRVVAGDGDQDGSRWQHPTATSCVSATVRHGCLFVYSTSTPFEPTEQGRPHGYTPFAAWALLNHGGDLSSAARAAREHKDGLPLNLDVSWADHTSPVTVSNGEDDQEEEDTLPVLVWPEMPTEAFHGVLGDIVRTLAPHSEADPAGILASLLVYTATSLGPGPHFRLSGTSHPARLDILIVGQSARARKGSAETMARWVMRTADPTVASERRATGLNSGEGLIDAVRDPKLSKDKQGNDVIVDDGVTDKRLLLFEPEFAGRLLVAINRSGATISAILRQAWDEGDLRTMSRNPMKATGAHICVLGNATIDELLQQASPQDIAAGLLNRFLFVAVRSTHRLPFGGSITDQEVEQLGRRLRHQLAAARVRTRVEFAPDARDSWPTAYEHLMDDAPDGPLGHLTARGPTQVQRLALVYALADGAAQIGHDHLVAALGFWAYCRDSAELVLAGQATGTLTGTPDGDRMLDMLVTSGRAWGTTELKEALGWNGTKAAAVRGRLERLGLIRTARVQLDGKGRPRTVVEAR